MNTTPPTNSKLDEIEARTNAATKGPWGFYDGDNYADVAADMQVTSPGSYSYREKIARLEDEDYWDDPAHEDDDESRAPEQMAANARFIAHAREDVPALLAEIRRLQTELDAAPGKALATAADVVDRKLAAEPDHNRASALYELLLQLRGELPCTCARSGGLHEKGCGKYVPGHELISRHNALARYRAERTGKTPAA